MKKLTFLFLSLSLAFASCQNKYPDLEKGVYAEFPFDSAKEFETRRPVRVRVEFEEKPYFMSLFKPFCFNKNIA